MPDDAVAELFAVVLDDTDTLDGLAVADDSVEPVPEESARPFPDDLASLVPEAEPEVSLENPDVFTLFSPAPGVPARPRIAGVAPTAVVAGTVPAAPPGTVPLGPVSMAPVAADPAGTMAGRVDPMLPTGASMVPGRVIIRMMGW